MAPSLHQSLLMVTDLETSISFYRDVVDIDPAELNEGNAEFDTGQCTLVLEADFEPAVLEEFGLEAPSDPRGEGVIVAIDVDEESDVDDVISRTREEGYPVRMEPREVPWGRYMALIEDPDGYTLEISTSA